MPLKYHLQKIFPQASQRPHSAAEFFAAAQEGWEQNSQNVLDNLIEGLPERLQAVLDVDGGHTKW